MILVTVRFGWGSSVSLTASKARQNVELQPDPLLTHQSTNNQLKTNLSNNDFLSYLLKIFFFIYTLQSNVL
jgi:hypothetical protein